MTINATSIEFYEFSVLQLQCLSHLNEMYISGAK